MAVKILQKTRIRDQSDIDRIARELNILQRLKHPNVILLYDVIFWLKSLINLITDNRNTTRFIYNNGICV